MYVENSARKEINRTRLPDTANHLVVDWQALMLINRWLPGLYWFIPETLKSQTLFLLDQANQFL